MIDNCKVTVFDSKSIAYPQANMVLNEKEMPEEGKNLEEILSHLKYLRDKHHLA